MERDDWLETEIPVDRTPPEAKILGIEEIPLNKIIEPTEDVRAWIPEEHIEALAASLAAVGLINEPTVVKRGDLHEIVTGHCRYLAAKRLGWETLRCKIVDAAEVDREFAKLHENMFRADLSPIEKGEFLARIKARYNLTDAELAQRLGKSRAWVTRHLKTQVWPQDIKDAVRDGAIGFEVAWEIAKIDDPDYRERLVMHAVRDGCTRKLAKMWVEDYFRTKRAMEAIHDQEAQYKMEQVKEDLLDRAVMQQIAHREMAAEAHRIPEVPCDVCQAKVREDATVYLRVCPDCAHLIQNAIRQAVATPEGA